MENIVLIELIYNTDICGEWNKIRVKNVAALWTSVFTKMLTNVHMEHAACSWDTIRCSAGQEILCFYGTRKFITLFVR